MIIKAGFLYTGNTRGSRGVSKIKNESYVPDFSIDEHCTHQQLGA